MTGWAVRNTRSCLSQTPALKTALPDQWDISLAASPAPAGFERWRPSRGLADLSLPEELPDFCGTVRYEQTFMMNAPPDGYVFLISLGDVYETAEVWVNKRLAGVKISSPYYFDITALLEPGQNRLDIRVTNTLVKAYPDKFSAVTEQEPTGMLGPVHVFGYAG